MNRSAKNLTKLAPKDLVVKFHEIPQGGLEFHFTSDSHALDNVLQDLLGTSPVYDITLKLEQLEAMAQVVGHIKGELPQTCSRCAEAFVTKLSKKFSTLYYKSEETIKSVPGGNMDDLESNLDLEQLDGNDINLGEAVHAQIMIDIPFQPLCKEECKGLCAQCGTNLNEERCQCSSENSKNNDDPTAFSTHSPFAKLKEWKN